MAVRTTTQPTRIELPRDYVRSPEVLPEEAQAGPRRIISLAPSITEIICALGSRDRLVGRTQYCQYPPGIEKVPAVGALMDTNYEFIKKLRPDLILVTANSVEVRKSLQQLNLRCEAIPHETLDDIYVAILQVGDFIGRPRTARSLVGAIATDLVELQRFARAIDLPTRRTLVTTGPLPVPPQALYIAGPGSFLDRLLTMAGQNNAASEVTRASYPEIALEKLVVLDPEVILEFRDNPTTQPPADVYTSWSQVGAMQAVTGRRVRTIGGQEWLSAGPRVAIELHHFITAMRDLKPAS